MERNYWKEYWDNYYKFMAVYLRELQNAYPDVDIKNEYLEVASLFEPSMPCEDYDNDEYDEVIITIQKKITIHLLHYSGGGQSYLVVHLHHLEEDNLLLHLYHLEVGNLL